MTQYFVVDKVQRNSFPVPWQMARLFETSGSVAAYMLGRSINDHFVVKSDAQGDRVVPWPSADVSEIQTALEQA